MQVKSIDIRPQPQSRIRRKDVPKGHTFRFTFTIDDTRYMNVQGGGYVVLNPDGPCHGNIASANWFDQAYVTDIRDPQGNPWTPPQQKIDYDELPCGFYVVEGRDDIRLWHSACGWQFAAFPGGAFIPLSPGDVGTRYFPTHRIEVTF